jgi:hypothetical protein
MKKKMKKKHVDADAAAATEVTEVVAKKGKKAKAEKATKPAKKDPVKKTAFGHREGTLTAVMDALLIKGTSLEDGAKAMAAFKGDGADDKACARQLKTHIKYLQSKKGANVVFLKKANKYKVSTKSADAE